MIKDAQQFVKTFSIPIVESVAHIYISALPFAPSSSKLFTHLRRSFRKTTVSQSEPAALSKWLTITPIIHVAPGERIHSLAFSPNGRFLASGSSYSGLKLWDAEIGDVIGGPLTSFRGDVRSVAFSPDGTRIVSGSDDQMIRFWDVTTQRQIGEPLKGHTGVISSVAFSPNSMQMASGSWDSTVCRWNTRTCRMVGEPLRGHSSGVNSVAFSPHSTRIISASNDRTIGIWDAETGNRIGNFITGHSKPISCVAFAPDGSQIASASKDGTVRRWNSLTGQPIGEPLIKSSIPVLSVAFSPDSKQIASTWVDQKIRLRDACTGEAIGLPLHAHWDWVRTVAFAPNGNTFASGSDDGMIRLWQYGARGLNDRPETSTPSSLVVQTPHSSGKTPAIHASHPTTTYPPNLPPRKALRLREDGWITGPINELILWVPVGLRNKVAVYGPEVIDSIDFTNFKCGTEWTDCWRGSEETQAGISSDLLTFLID